MDLQTALQRASEWTSGIMIDDPQRLLKTHRRKLHQRHGVPMVRFRDFWHEVVGFRELASDLFVFRTEERDQYKPSI